MFRNWMTGGSLFRAFFEPNDGNSGSGTGGGGAAPAATPAAPAAAPAASAGGGTGASATPAGSNAGGVSSPASGQSQTAGGFGANAVPGFNATNAPANQTGTPGVNGQQPPATDLSFQFQQLQSQFNALLPLARLGYETHQQRGQQPQQPQPGAGQQPQQPANPFGLPQWDRRLEKFLTRDAQGRIVAEPGAPFNAAAQYQDYTEKFQDALHNFFQDPVKFLQPLIDQRAKQIAGEAVQGSLGGYQQQVQAQAIHNEIAEWAYVRDPQTKAIVYDVNPLTQARTEKLSPTGQFYLNELRAAESFGIKEPQAKHQYAIRMLNAAMLQAKQQQNQNQQAGQQQQQQFVQNGQQPQQQPVPGANVAPAHTQSNVPVEQPTVSLREMMAKAFREEGLDAATIERQLRGNAA